jgi:hypothetical protein
MTNYFDNILFNLINNNSGKKSKNLDEEIKNNYINCVKLGILNENLCQNVTNYCIKNDDKEIDEVECEKAWGTNEELRNYNIEECYNNKNIIYFVNENETPVDGNKIKSDYKWSQEILPEKYKSSFLNYDKPKFNINNILSDVFFTGGKKDRNYLKFNNSHILPDLYKIDMNSFQKMINKVNFNKIENFIKIIFDLPVIEVSPELDKEAIYKHTINYNLYDIISLNDINLFDKFIINYYISSLPEKYYDLKENPLYNNVIEYLQMDNTNFDKDKDKFKSALSMQFFEMHSNILDNGNDNDKNYQKIYSTLQYYIDFICKNYNQSRLKRIDEWLIFWQSYKIPLFHIINKYEYYNNFQKLPPIITEHYHYLDGETNEDLFNHIKNFYCNIFVDSLNNIQNTRKIILRKIFELSEDELYNSICIKNIYKQILLEKDKTKKLININNLVICKNNKFNINTPLYRLNPSYLNYYDIFKSISDNINRETDENLAYKYDLLTSTKIDLFLSKIDNFNTNHIIKSQIKSGIIELVHLVFDIKNYKEELLSETIIEEAYKKIIVQFNESEKKLYDMSLLLNKNNLIVDNTTKTKLKAYPYSLFPYINPYETILFINKNIKDETKLVAYYNSLKNDDVHTTIGDLVTIIEFFFTFIQKKIDKFDKENQPSSPPTTPAQSEASKSFEHIKNLYNDFKKIRPIADLHIENLVKFARFLNIVAPIYSTESLSDIDSDIIKMLNEIETKHSIDLSDLKKYNFDNLYVTNKKLYNHINKLKNNQKSITNIINNLDEIFIKIKKTNDFMLLQRLLNKYYHAS